MPEGTNKKKRRYTFNWGRLKFFIVLVVLAYTVVTMAGQQETLSKEITRQEELTRSQAETEQRLEYYENELDYIGTDEYVEQEARSRFGWVRSGEIKYLEGSSSDVGTTPARDAQSSARPSASASAEPSGSPEPSASPSADASASESRDEGGGGTLSPEQVNAQRVHGDNAG
ncbi:MAG: hypothetical protein HDQ87_02220 [Clostridia bacterium]|nr:hypothetical protein [Clostridia bacterium]